MTCYPCYVTSSRFIQTNGQERDGQPMCDACAKIFDTENPPSNPVEKPEVERICSWPEGCKTVIPKLFRRGLCGKHMRMEDARKAPKASKSYAATASHTPKPSGKFCSVPDCANWLRSDNTSGICTPHFKNGWKLVDGKPVERKRYKKHSPAPVTATLSTAEATRIPHSSPISGIVGGPLNEHAQWTPAIANDEPVEIHGNNVTNIVVDEFRHIAESELQTIDAMLRNRTALDGIDGRIAKIQEALAAAGRGEQLKNRHAGLLGQLYALFVGESPRSDLGFAEQESIILDLARRLKEFHSEGMDRQREALDKGAEPKPKPKPNVGGFALETTTATEYGASNGGKVWGKYTPIVELARKMEPGMVHKLKPLNLNGDERKNGQRLRDYQKALRMKLSHEKLTKLQVLRGPDHIAIVYPEGA